MIKNKMKNFKQNLLTAVFCIFSLAVISNSVAAIELSEIMYNPSGSDSGKEWLEFVSEEELNVEDLKFFDNSGPHTLTQITNHTNLTIQTLNSGDYFVITNNEDKFFQNYPNYAGILFKSSFSLLNSGEEVGLLLNNTEIINITYPTNLANGNNKTLTYLDGFWDESEEFGGTPGQNNNIEVPEFNIITTIITMLAGMILFLGFRKNS